MKRIVVSAEHSYEVRFCRSWKSEVEAIVGERNHLFLVSGAIATALGVDAKRSDVLVLPDGEEQKSFTSLELALRECARRGLTRNSVIIGIGGGATTDIAGFVAATYMRGIDWIAVPTSVAGMVDAAIGGKTGINISEGKNLVGSFHSPARVAIDLDLLRTLSLRDKSAGLAEVVKCGFIKDSRILDLIENGVESNLEELIYRSVAVKAEVVSKDFKESGEREILNYGHTLGHAIEAHSKYSLRHGEAIAIGLVFAAELSHRYGALDAEIVARHRSILEMLQLPIGYSRAAWGELLQLMKSDKKRKGPHLRFISLEALGKTSRIDSVTDEDLSLLYGEKIAR